MANRFALIVGSQCAALPRLGFVEELASGLYSALTRGGGWQPVVDSGLLLNPTVAELKREIKKAFAVANASSATLLISFLGHGSSVGTQDFRLLAVDSPGSSADSDTAVHLTQAMRERLGECQSLDGLVVLVDACEASEGVAGAAARWPEMLTVDGRFELLVASGDHNAYDGCFTRTLLDLFASGIPSAGSQLLCIDIIDDLAGACPKQIPHHTSHTRGSPVRTGVGDRGLWLVPNPALNRNAVTGQAAAGLVDQLTTGVLITDTVRDALQAILDARSAPLRLVLGPPGSGKSTLLSLLTRPNLVEDLDINEKYVTAAVFLDTTSTLDSLTADLTAQLVARVPGYAATRDAVRDGLADEDRATLTGFDIDITRSLQRCGKRVTLVIDGLDQPDVGARQIILGSHHPETLRTRGSLAFWQGASGSPMAAVAEYRNQVEERRRLLGPDHPNTLRAQENLAVWLGAGGDMNGAIAEYEELHAIRLRLLGPSHPATIAASRGIAFWRSIQKQRK